MAEFQEVMKQWRRMCETCTCSNKGELVDFPECPIILHHCGYPCDECPQDWTKETTEQFEKIVMEWAAEHPEPVYPTWIDWLYNNGLVLKPVGWDMMFPGVPFKPKCVTSEKAEQEIPADIAQKLGLKPKEG